MGTGGALGEPYEELLIKGRPTCERFQIAAADHVRAVEGMADQTLRNGPGYQRAQSAVAPDRRFVVQTLSERLTAHFPASPQLVEAVLGTYSGPRLALTNGAVCAHGHVVVTVIPEVAGVELEAVDAID
jgi:hypothetical protein